MKIFKSRIVAVVLTLAMVFSVLAVPVAAADQATTAPAKVTQPATTDDAAKFLSDKGLLQGDNGDLMLDKELTREQMVVILSRLMGQEEEAKAYPTDNMPFVDVPLEDEYAPYIAWAYDNQITQGMDETTFGFGESLTAEQTKLFFVRVLGYTDLSDEEQIAKADELNVTAGSTAADKEPIKRADMALLMSNTVFATAADGKVLGDTIGVLAPVEPPVVTPATADVVSAKMATDSSVTVTFASAVADTSKLAFAVSGPSAVTTTVAWNDAKTEATLKSSSVLLEGAYTVKVTGEGVTADKNTATFTVVKNGPAKIEFTSDKLVKLASTSAPYQAEARYKITDQYGVDITKNVLDSDLTVAASKSLVTPGAQFSLNTSRPGVLTLNFASAIDLTNEKTVVVTLISKQTGVSASASLTTGDVAKADTVELGQVTFPTTTPATTRIITKTATAAYIPVVVKDQYSNVITDKNAIATNDVLFVKSDSNLDVAFENYKDASNNDAIRLVLNTAKINTAETVSLTVVTTVAGKSTATTLKLEEAAKADKVSVGSQTQVVAEGDATEKFVLPLTAVDQYGTQLSADEIITNVDNGNITISSDSTFAVGISRSGDNKGKIVNTDSTKCAKGTHVVSVMTKTGSVATYNVDVKDAAYPKTIALDKTPASNLLVGSTTKVSYKFTDQYGREVKAPGSAHVTLELPTGTTVASVNMGGNTTTAANLSGDNYATLTAGTEGTVTMTAKLWRIKDGVTAPGTFPTDYNAISTVDSTFTVAKGVPSSLTYSINDIPTLAYAKGSTATAINLNGTDAYAREITITAKDASGNTYAIPASRIDSVVSLDPTIAQVAKVTGTPTVTEQETGSYVVAGQLTAFNNDSTKGVVDAAGATKTATIKAIILTDNGPQEVTKTVTVKNELPKVQSVVFADKGLKTGYPYSLNPDAKTVTQLSGTASDIAKLPLFVMTLDQYGVYAQDDAASFTVVNPDRFAGNVVFDTNAVSFKNYQALTTDPIYLMYKAGSVYGTLSLKVSDAVNAKAVTATKVDAPAVTGYNTYSVADGSNTVSLKDVDTNHIYAFGPDTDGVEVTVGNDATDAYLYFNQDTSVHAVGTYTFVVQKADNTWVYFTVVR